MNRATWCKRCKCRSCQRAAEAFRSLLEASESELWSRFPRGDDLVVSFTELDSLLPIKEQIRALAEDLSEPKTEELEPLYGPRPAG